MLKIDCHLHVNFNDFTAYDIIQYMDKRNIEKCWLLTWEDNNPSIPSLSEHLSINDLMDAYNKYPDRIVPFYAPDPNSGNIKEIMEKHVQMGVRGCGELKVSCKWEDSTIEQYLQVISDLKLPLLFHMESPRMHYVKNNDGFVENLLNQFFKSKLISNSTKHLFANIAKKTPFIKKKIKSGLQYFPGYMFDFMHLEKRVNQFPSIKYIGHGPKFWENIGEVTSPKLLYQSSKIMFPKGKIKKWGIIDTLLEEYDNFYCDISGTSGFNALSRDPAKSKLFLEKHSKKIIFGTDNSEYKYGELLQSLNLPKETIRDIYYNNAKHIIQ